jgi:AcrR family transcriptional regulator
MSPAPPDPAEPSAREAEILAAALDCMVADGDRFSMASVARAASCSKETLYRWFGDRDGLLTATVRWQAAKVGWPQPLAGAATRPALRETLAAFAERWLAVITGEASVGLNRLAVSHPGPAPEALGAIVLENGPRAMAERLRPTFEAARRSGLIAYGRFEDAFSLFFGLVVRDTQIRLLLGEGDPPPPAAHAHRAREAADQFLALVAPPPREGEPR